MSTPFSRQEPCPGSKSLARAEPRNESHGPVVRCRRAPCPECGRSIQIHQDGTLYKHVRVYTINYPPAPPDLHKTP